MRSSGEWVDVFLPEGHVAVLAGHTLERATCGLIKAAKHRVVCFQQLYAHYLQCPQLSSISLPSKSLQLQLMLLHLHKKVARQSCHFAISNA